MSLINQMLRDLETRRKAGARQLPSGEGPAVFVANGSSRRLLFIVIGGLVLIGLAWGGLAVIGRLMSGPKASVKLASVAAPAQRVVIHQQQSRTNAEVQSAVSKPVLAAEAAIVAFPAAVADDSAHGVPADRSALLNLRVLETLVSTRLLLEFEQRPDYVWRFQDQGETQVILRLTQAGGGEQVNIPKLQGPLLKQVRLQEDKQELLVLVEANQKVKVQTFELPADPFHGERLLVEFYHWQPVEKPVAKDAAAIVTVTEKSRIKVTAPKPNRVNKTAVTLTPEEQAEQAYQAALKKLQRGDYSAAENGFSQALSLQPQRLDARLQLIDLLQELGRFEAAGKYLLEGLTQHPGNPQLRKNYARNLMDEGYLQGAIDILQSEPRPDFDSDLEYYALLAALQQEIGQHHAASRTYRQLLKYRPQQALWWMGLAISTEQMGDSAAAKEAYQQAIALPGLRADLQDYIHTRLQAL